jgi:hypothetical protein
MNTKWIVAQTSRMYALFFVFSLGAGIAACSGGGVLGGGDGDACRTDDDCSGDLYCRGPNQPNVCGVPPRELCVTDMDCPMGTLCHSIWDGCSTDAIGSECKPPCTADNCGPDFRCNANGACEPIPCDEGFSCPERQTCNAMIAHDMTLPMHARSSGCVNIMCSDDQACPAGKVCVTGYCQDGQGSCREDIAVP